MDKPKIFKEGNTWFTIFDDHIHKMDKVINEHADKLTICVDKIFTENFHADKELKMIKMDPMDGHITERYPTRQIVEPCINCKAVSVWIDPLGGWGYCKECRRIADLVLPLVRRIEVLERRDRDNPWRRAGLFCIAISCFLIGYFTLFLLREYGYGS